MAQETKVGLVVGLGFIVCFATILANRGGDRIRPQMPYELFDRAAPPQGGPSVSLPSRPMAAAPQAEHSATPERIVPTAPDREASSRGPDRTRSTIADPDRFEHRRAPIPKPLDFPEPTYALAGGSEESGMSYLADGAEGPYAGGELDSPAASPVRTLAAEPGLPQALQPYADQFERPGTRRLADADRTRHATAGEKHVVQPGDSLGKIAKRYYGSGSMATVTALFEANRDVLKSPDTVVAGDTLRLPELNGIQPGPAAPQPATLVKTQPTGKTQPNFRWYKVQKGEMLGTIAQRQLGSSKRWKEIMELNQDICPDPRRLQAGMEIRIPLETFADAR